MLSDGKKELKDKKLGFWAPPSISRCQVHREEQECAAGCEFLTHNKKI
jgi:hypothetical protein